MVGNKARNAPIATKPEIFVTPPGPGSRALAERLAQSECSEVTYISENFPIFWSRAKGCIVEDVDGNAYLDFSAAFAVASIGHTHPKVVSAVQSQAELLLHGMGDVHPTALKIELAEQLTELAPGDIGRPIFSCSGSEAVESARKSCVMATGKPGLLAFTNAYHGLTFGALEATSRPDFRQPFDAQWAGCVKHLPYPYCYRCPFQLDHPRCDLACVNVISNRLKDSSSGFGNIGGVLIEPIQGRGGTIVPPPGYMPRLREVCDEHGILLIFDEIFTGFGRTGSWFAADNTGVVPDLMAVGKALGGGVPISACIGRPQIMARWGRSTGEAIHTSTFLGNPLACAAGLAVLEVMRSENIPKQARDKGVFLMEQLQRLQTKHRQIGDVRGAGLMVGIELVTDRESRKPSAGLAVSVMELALREGLILLPEGPQGNVIGINPPLIIEEEQLVWGIEVIDRCLKHLVG